MEKNEVNQALRFGPYEITGGTGASLAAQSPAGALAQGGRGALDVSPTAGQVVSKEELFTAVWPETVVSEGVLTSRIRELRQALGDTTATPRYIETVSRRGYRFIEKVSRSQPLVDRREEEGQNSKLTEQQGKKFFSSVLSPQHSALRARWPRSRTDTTSQSVC